MDREPGGELTFDHVDHAYFVDGVRKPNVTEILQEAGLTKLWGSADQQAYARDLGIAVHKACELHDRGTLLQSSVDPVVRPYLDAYLMFLEVNRPEILAIEERVYHRELGYCGTLDRAMVLPSARGGRQSAIVDFKSGVLRRASGPQTAAYLHAYTPKHWANWNRYALHLKGDATYELVPYRSENDWRVFVAALTVHRWRQAA